MKIKYFKSSDPNVPCIQDLDQSYEDIQNLDKMFGNTTTREAHQKKSVRFFELMKAKGQITSFEII